MEFLYYGYIFVLWLIFWSFSSVIIHRLKSQKKWMFLWRSECPNCKHLLNYKDLFPVFSFLSTGWKCRYCKSKISFIYPILELSMWLIFLASAYFLVDINLILWLDVLEIIKLFFYLVMWVLTIVYVFYDILFLEIPDSVLFIQILLAYIFLAIQSYLGFNFMPNILWSFEITNIWFIGVLAFWTALIWGFYMIMLKELEYIYDILILVLWGVGFYILSKIFPGILLEMPLASWLIWAYAFFLFFFLQILVSGGKWMWGWDLRIAILIWLFVWIKRLFFTWLTTYMIWSILWILIIFVQFIKRYKIVKSSNFEKFKIKLGKKKYSLDTQIPFGPFLAVGMYLMIFFETQIMQFFQTFIMPY